MKRDILVLFLLLFFVQFVFAACDKGQIDINSASLEELDELYGVGPAKAQAIINSRPYESVDELTNAYGIGDATLEKIKDQGLACVLDFDKIKSITNEKNESINSSDNLEDEKDEIDGEKEIKRIVIENNITKEKKEPPKKEPIILAPIGPDSKDIKSDSHKDYSSRYAIIGLFGLLIVVSILIFVRNRRYEKNEFT